MSLSEAENVLYLEGRLKNIKKAKAVKKSVVKKQIMHEQYKETLFGKQQLLHGMNILQSMDSKETGLETLDHVRYFNHDDWLRGNVNMAEPSGNL